MEFAKQFRLVVLLMEIRGQHMENTTKNLLTEAGINVEAAMHRFLDDEEMYFEFLNEFLEDDLINRLKQAVNSGQIQESFDIAHTLKGVCANLSIDSMSRIVNPMVEILRSNSLAGVREAVSELWITYGQVSEVIKGYCR